jgi:hypothetical protein
MAQPAQPHRLDRGMRSSCLRETVIQAQRRTQGQIARAQRASEAAEQAVEADDPPQGHWCNINGSARRRARSLTAKRWTDPSAHNKGRGL